MPARKRKRKTRKASGTIPSPDTVVAEFDIPARGGKVIHVLRTNQKDPYDPPARAPRKRGK